MPGNLLPKDSMTRGIALVALGCSIVALVIALVSLFTAHEARESNPFIEGSEARQAAERDSNRLRSATNSRGLVLGIIAYASNHDGKAPDQDRWRQLLIDQDIATAEMFTPRGAADVEHAYHYIRPTPDQIRALQETGVQAGESSGTDSIVVLYEDPGLWRGEGGHVTYLDTSTEWIEGEAFAEFVRELRAGG